MMYEWDDILIVGDSFVAFRDEYFHWPQKLTCMLTDSQYIHRRVPRGKGHAGCSFWSTRNELLRNLQHGVPKLLIMVHTDAHRLPSDYDFPVNVSSPDHLLNHARHGTFGEHTYMLNQEFVETIKLYYKHLYSDMFHAWAHKKWLEEVDDLIELYQIPRSVHMHITFQKNKEFYVFRNGITVADTLASMVLWGDEDSGRKNHFTPEENVKLADKIYDLIVNYAGDGKLVSLNWNTP
jgi:hypothetical protein